METAVARVLDAASSSTPRLIALPTVLDWTSLSEPTVRRMVDRGLFPRPLKLSSNRIAWREPDVSAWINSRVEAA